MSLSRNIFPAASATIAARGNTAPASRPISAPAASAMARPVSTCRQALYGGHSQYLYLHPRTVFHKVPEGMPPHIAAMALPLGNGFQWTYFDGKAGPDKTVVDHRARAAGLRLHRCGRNCRRREHRHGRVSPATSRASRSPRKAGRHAVPRHGRSRPARRDREGHGRPPCRRRHRCLRRRSRADQCRCRPSEEERHHAVHRLQAGDGPLRPRQVRAEPGGHERHARPLLSRPSNSPCGP